MKLGLRLPQRLGVDLQHDLVEAARTAEAAGYASLWTYERLLFPETPAEPYAPPNVPWPETSRQAADPLGILTAAAMATEKVRLGTSVLVAALHTPVQLAKALATVDQISGGRMIVGMSTGWSTDELQATGATQADRGRFLDETLVFDAVWGPDPVTFRSPRGVIDNASILPKPVSNIPVMLGGGGGPQHQLQGPRAHCQTRRRLVAATYYTRSGRSRRTARKLGPYSGNGYCAWPGHEPDGVGRGGKRHLHGLSGRT